MEGMPPHIPEPGYGIMLSIDSKDGAVDAQS